MTLHVSFTTRPGRPVAPAYARQIACFKALLSIGYPVAYARALAALYTA